MQHLSGGFSQATGALSASEALRNQGPDGIHPGEWAMPHRCRRAQQGEPDKSRQGQVPSAPQGGGRGPGYWPGKAKALSIGRCRKSGAGGTKPRTGHPPSQLPEKPTGEGDLAPDPATMPASKPKGHAHRAGE